MDTKEYIESGILELYVFGALNDEETSEVAKIAQEYPEIQAEILSIEKAIMTLNFSMSPKLSADNYARIKAKIFDNNDGIIQMRNNFEDKSSSNWKSYMGWAAAVIFAAGIGYQYMNTQKIENQVVSIEKEKSKLKTDLNSLKLKNKNAEQVLAIVRDEKNTIISLAGQAVAPEAKAKIYWNKETQVVYVDASGLPEPPEGMEYQIWSLKMNPLTPTSIGMLTNFKDNESKLFAVNSTDGAEAFGITLEPKGGSLTPTMEQLYTLGKV
jgi:anti-sigma-K factor RskA